LKESDQGNISLDTQSNSRTNTPRSRITMASGEKIRTAGLHP
jgi:hypothetical protein